MISTQIFLKIRGGSTPPSKIQGGLRPPQPPYFGAPAHIILSVELLESQQLLTL